MRPLKLELAGFTCFREETRVSFDDLSLFAIAGPTGSGKSTILDAMTYALYGQTPRLGSRGLDALLSPGATQMYVVLDFEGGRGQAYRVTRTLDKKSNRVEPNVRIQELVGGDWKQLPESEKIREANSKLEDLVGLDYDGFTRAVMLPQGAFDEFLHGDAGKRRRLLVNLLGLDRLEAMQKEAGQRARRAEAEREGIQKWLERDYAGASPERARELKDELASLQQRKTGLNAERTELEACLKGLDEVKELLDEHAKAQAKLAELAADADAFGRDKLAHRAAQQAALIAPQLEELERKQAKVEGLETTERELEGRRSALQESLDRARDSLRKAEQEAERLPEITGQLEALAGVAPLVAQLKERGGELTLAGRSNPQATYSDAAWDALQAQRLQLPGLRRALRDAADGERSLKQAVKALAEAQERAAALTAELTQVREQGKVARERLNDAEAALQKAELADRAAALRPHLHLGEPCPVCEQAVTALPAQRETGLAAMKRARDEAKAALEQLLEAHNHLKSQFDTATARTLDREAEVKRASEAMERHQERLAEAREAFAPLALSEPEQIEARLEDVRLGLLAALAATIRERAQGLDPERAPAQLNADKKKIEAGLKSAQEQATEAQQALKELTTRLELTREQKRDLEFELTAAREAFAGVLAGAGFATADELRAAALPESRLQALELRLRTYEREREAALRREVELQSRLAGRTLDEAAYARMQARRAEVTQELETVQRGLGSTQQLLDDLQRQLERARELRGDLKRLTETYETFRQLSLDLRGNEFPDYLLARVQSELAIRASKILRNVTDGRYDLRLCDNEYQVIDAWNTGEPRSAKTLSGGETFIASLALALALSDTVAGSTALGALFLDEGFGTLDAETLDAVAGVLEALTAEGRLVGVITHVTALTDRLPARLRVHKGPDGSSLYWDA